MKVRMTMAARPRMMRRSKMRLELRARMAMLGVAKAYRAVRICAVEDTGKALRVLNVERVS